MFVSCQNKFWDWNLFHYCGCVLGAELESRWFYLRYSSQILTHVFHGNHCWKGSLGISPIPGIQPQFLPLLLLLILTTVIPTVHFKRGDSGWSFLVSLSFNPCPFQSCWMRKTAGAAPGRTGSCRDPTDSCRDVLQPGRHNSSPKADVKPSDSISCYSKIGIIIRDSSGSSPQWQQVGEAPLHCPHICGGD